MPVVWASLDDAGAGDPASPVVDELVGPLVVVYAFDLGDELRVVTVRDLERLGVDQATLATSAVDNLIDRMSGLQLLERPDGCGMVRLDGHLEASTLLVGQLWDDIAEVLGDEVLVAVPAPDTVLFCAAHDERTKAALRAARDRAFAVGHRTMTEDLFRYNGRSWQVEPA